MIHAPPPLARRWARQSLAGGPLVIAHRGASAVALENTLTAFRMARELGADGVELDVMRCGTGEVVVFHDDDLARLASRPDAIRSMPLAALREVRMAGGETIPTLEEVLEACGDKLLVNVELKSPTMKGLGYLRALSNDGLAQEVARILLRAASPSRFLVSSFDPLQLGRFRSAAPTVATGLLFHEHMARPLREAWAAPWLRPLALHPEADVVTPASLAQWRKGGYAVNVWVVDDAREIAWLTALGVDGLITNRPDEARRAILRVPHEPRISVENHRIKK